MFGCSHVYFFSLFIIACLFQITWTHEGRSLPDNAIQEGGTLTILQVKRSDAGRYECQARTDADVGSDYINLRVEGNLSLPSNGLLEKQHE